MTVASEIQRIKNNVAAAYAAAENKGAIMPATRNSNNLSTTISTIEAHAEPVLQDKTVIYNGEYTADEGYDGLREVTVDVASTGSTIPATNYTGEAINVGDKVWINKYVYESGSSVSLSRQTTRVMPDFNFYVNGTNLYRVSDNIQVGSFNNSVGGYHMNYANGLTVTSSTYYRNGVTSYYRNGIVIANFGSTAPIAGRPDLIVQSDTLKKIDPETGEILASYTGSVRTYDDYASASSNVMIGSYIYTYYGIYLVDDENLTVTAINQNGNPFYYPGCIPIIGFTSDGKYMITGNNNGSSYGKVWRINGNSATNVNTTFPDIGNLDTYNYIFYQSTNLLVPKNTANLATNPVYQYNPATETWDAVPVNASGLQDTKVQFNPEMTKYATGNSPYRVINLVATIGTYLYPYAQMNMSLNTVTGTAAENISVGATGNVYLGDKGNLQSKAATSNGTIRPDSDYYGLKSVTVNVVGTGAEVEGKNYTGAVINEGDKVWINSYSYDEGAETQIAPVHHNYIHNTAFYLISADGQAYIIKGTSTSTPRGHYRTSDNTLISNTGLPLKAKIIPNPNDGGSTFISVSGEATSSTQIFMHSYTGNTTFDNTISRIIFNAPWLLVKQSVVDNVVSYTIDKYDLASRTLISETPIEIPSTLGTNSAHLYAGVRLDDENILIVNSYSTAGLYTYDSTANKWGLTRTVTISGSVSNNYLYGFVTPDGKYMLMGTRLCYLGDVLSGGNITSTSFSLVSAADTGYYSCIANGNSFKLLVHKSIDSKTYNLVYNYNSETGTFDQVAIDKDNPDTNQFAGCDADMNYQVFLRPYYSSQYDAYLVNTHAATGNFLVSYAPSNITVDTQTGIATESITAGNTGTVKVGAAIIPEGSTTITENGTYDVTNYAEAVVNISSDNENIYSLNMVEEVEDGLYNSSITIAGLTAAGILGGDATLTPLRSTWKYKPSTLAEYYQETLTSDHVYAEEKLTEVLGAVNE